MIARVPHLVQKAFGRYIWRIEDTAKNIYLTFDDGPIPEITPWVLDQLKKHGARATFFCVGSNVKKYPEIFESIKKQGHAIGNHSFTHPDGRKTGTEEYIMDVHQCDEVVKSEFFRPPYGRLTRSQSNRLKKEYRIVLWDVLSMDYDLKVTPKKVVENVVHNARTGSIVVFH